MSCYQEKNWQAAVDILRRSLEQKPDTGPRLMLGISLANLDFEDQAREALPPALMDESVADSARSRLAYLENIR